MPKVYAKFPRTGLGNMMLIWARGLVFSRVNRIPFVCSLWYGLRLGPLLRNEPKKRFYWGYFKETPLTLLIITRLSCLFSKKKFNPPVHVIKSTLKNENFLYIYDSVMIDEDLFGQIRDYQELIKSELDRLLLPEMKMQLTKYQKPVISVHIRRGDFKFGSPLTPLSYFINAIKLIRQTIGENWPVTVFTDAKMCEVAEIFEMPEIFLAEDKADILDILLMSKSNVIILSKSSTFSYWGAFLSEAIVVRSTDDWQDKIRTPNDSELYTEVDWDENDKSTDIHLVQALKKNHASFFSKHLN